jgi:hypothetical protein
VSTFCHFFLGFFFFSRFFFLVFIRTFGFGLALSPIYRLGFGLGLPALPACLFTRFLSFSLSSRISSFLSRFLSLITHTKNA